MKVLLDVNILVAWGWTDHVDHERVVDWIARCLDSGGVQFHTSSIPELGFIRVSVQRAAGRVTIADAAVVLQGMIDALGAVHRFLPDDLDGRTWPTWCTSASRTTDAHLLELASRHGLRLATPDAGIPGALLID